jgi:hypothetical protein
MTDAQFRRYWHDGLLPIGQPTAMAIATAREKRFFHWFLEFPDIIARGGFDCILGNPPYKGGTNLSGLYGQAFCRYVKWEYEPAGLSDLVVYFVRRIYTLLKPAGFTAFIDQFDQGWRHSRGRSGADFGSGGRDKHGSPRNKVARSGKPCSLSRVFAQRSVGRASHT